MRELRIAIEVAGCPTVCMHCWAQGTSYGAMPLEDVRRALHSFEKATSRAGLALRAYPMHEVAAHPDAAEVIRLFVPHVATELEPFATTGVPLATRDDWDNVLAAAREAGTTTVWVAFHGVGDEHDRQVNRNGAYAETLIGIERAKSAGMRAGGNVFLTKPNLARFDELLSAVDALPLDELAFMPADYYPTNRHRRYGAEHPELDELAAVADDVVAASPLYRAQWRDLGGHAESAWVRRADSGEWPTPPPSDAVAVVCRSNLDVHIGVAGAHGRHLGNLRSDDAGAIIDRALAAPSVTLEELHLRAAGIPNVGELAVEWGDAKGQEVHFFGHSMRNRWLHRRALGSRLALGV